MQTTLVRDPRINIVSPQESSMVVLQGAQRVTQYVIGADSSSLNQTNWSFQPPSTKIIVDRHIQLRCRVRITAVDGVFERGVATALRQAPLASITESLTVNLNGGSINDSVSRRIHAMLQYGNNSETRRKCFSKTAGMPDQYQEYEDWQNPVIGGSNRNVFAAYGENANEPTRGSVVPISATATELVYEITEPLFVSPMLTGFEGPQSGMTNVNQIDINIKWVSNISRILSHYNTQGNTLTQVNVEFDQVPQLLVNYLTPDNSYPLPNLQLLEYSKYNDYIKVQGVAQPGAQQQAVSDSIKLNQIPKHILLYLKRSDATSTFLTTDTFARIDSVNVLWNNESSLFSTYSSQGLYDIASNNGVNVSYPQWSQHTGGVLMINFGGDLGLMEGLAAGTMGQFTFQATVNYTNTSGQPVEYSLYMCPLLIGSAEISENALALNLGNMSVPMVRDAEMNSLVLHHKSEHVAGGSFYSGFKHFINRLSRGVERGAAITEKYVAPALSMFEPELGIPLGLAAAGTKQVAGAVRGLTGGGRGGAYPRRRMQRRR